MSQNVLTDSGFWIAYFENSDEHHHKAHEWANIIFNSPFIIICPFPSLYEFLNTRFARRSDRIEELEKLIKKLNIEYIYDDNYRFDLITNFITTNRYSPKLSSVDIIINKIIEDINIKIDFVVTFNEDDFKSACQGRNITILSE